MSESLDAFHDGFLSVAHSRAVADVMAELGKAATRFESFNSPHEGWAVIREELDELWEHVRANTGRGAAARHEAMHVAAMALRYMADLSDMSVDKRRCPQFAPHVEHEYDAWWCPGVKA